MSDGDMVEEGTYIYRGDDGEIGMFYASDPASLAGMIAQQKRKGEVWPYTYNKYVEVSGKPRPKPSIVEQLRSWLGH